MVKDVNTALSYAQRKAYRSIKKMNSYDAEASRTCTNHICWTNCRMPCRLMLLDFKPVGESPGQHLFPSAEIKESIMNSFACDLSYKISILWVISAEGQRFISGLDIRLRNT